MAVTTAINDSLHQNITSSSHKSTAKIGSTAACQHIPQISTALPVHERKKPQFVGNRVTPNCCLLGLNELEVHKLTCSGEFDLFARTFIFGVGVGVTVETAAGAQVEDAVHRGRCLCKWVQEAQEIGR